MWAFRNDYYFKNKKKFKTAFFWHEDKRIKTTIFGKNNYQHCVGMLLPRLNTKDTIFHLGAIYLLYWQLEMCYKYENLTLLSLRTMLELGALYLIMRLMQCRNDRLRLSLLLNLVSMNYNSHMSWMHQRHLTIIGTLISLIVTWRKFLHLFVLA